MAARARQRDPAGRTAFLLLAQEDLAARAV